MRGHEGPPGRGGDRMALPATRIYTCRRTTHACTRRSVCKGATLHKLSCPYVSVLGVMLHSKYGRCRRLGRVGKGDFFLQRSVNL